MSGPAVKSSKNYTVQEYVAFERTAKDKHEYDNGEILAMSLGSHQPDLRPTDDREA